MVRTMTMLGVSGAIALATVGVRTASAATIPANEAWTESLTDTGTPILWSWGTYSGSIGSITFDTSPGNYTTGTGSVKYTDYVNNGTMQPSITFYNGGSADLTPYAGGTFSFDFKYDGPANHAFTWIYLSNKNSSNAWVNNAWSMPEAASLTQGVWNHVEAVIPATWDTSGERDPAAITRIMFAIGFRNGSSYDTTPRTFWIDNMKFTAVPEPSTAVLMLLGGLPMLLRRRRST